MAEAIKRLLNKIILWRTTEEHGDSHPSGFIRALRDSPESFGLPLGYDSIKIYCEAREGSEKISRQLCRSHYTRLDDASPYLLADGPVSGRILAACDELRSIDVEMLEVFE